MTSQRKTPSIDEKLENIETPSDGSIDLRGGDEALKLVNAEEVTQFSEEYNLRLRRKLVRIVSCL